MSPKPPIPFLNWLALPLAATLELVTEKINAHSREISSVGFSPDGKTIVSACYGGTLKVWDAGER